MARGHPSITAKHKTTFEITKDPYLTLRGDCIIAVSASKAAYDLSWEFKQFLKSEATLITFKLEVGPFTWMVKGYGSEKMILTDVKSMVFRRSQYICPRTVMIKADSSASSLPREILPPLKNPDTVVHIALEAFRE
ncbi:DUF371 domain-containing protein [Candidatus Bathyarchaeota archaeon]|nr:DUF371 domain-containing protein [Candidatus Bathyarchaeota archaeon]